MTSRFRDKEKKLEHNTLTFRIDQDIVDELRQESKQKMASDYEMMSIGPEDFKSVTHELKGRD